VSREAFIEGGLSKRALSKRSFLTKEGLVWQALASISCRGREASARWRAPLAKNNNRTH